MEDKWEMIQLEIAPPRRTDFLDQEAFQAAKEAALMSQTLQVQNNLQNCMKQVFQDSRPGADGREFGRLLGQTLKDILNPEGTGIGYHLKSFLWRS